MKLLRFAYFNIRKHKSESISLFILTLLTTVLLVSSVAGLTGADRVVDAAFEKTGSFHNFVYMPLKDYKDSYLEFVKNDERVKEVVVTEFIWGADTKYLDQNGDEKSLMTGFSTQDFDAAVENLVLESSRTMEEITEKEHFVIMPYYMKDSLGYREGDTFELLYNKNVYPFEVAGFYETGLSSQPMSSTNSVQMIISDADYGMLQKVLTRLRLIAFDMKDAADADAFLDDLRGFAEEIAVKAEASTIYYIAYNDIKKASSRMTAAVIYIMIVMAVAVMAAVVFVIGYRIKSDIDEQMVSIGVREALGYKSKEIILSYVLEYLVISGIAVVVGLAVSLFTAPLMGRVTAIMAGYHGGAGGFGVTGVLLGVLLLVFVAVISFFSARRVKKYPPVVAFRKGTGNHSHKKNILPLEKTKTNVHVRLAAKGFLSNTKTNIGMGFCIGISVLMLVICFLLFDVFKGGLAPLRSIFGIDVADLRVESMTGTDPEALKAELLEMPEVRKVNLSNNAFDLENSKVYFPENEKLFGIAAVQQNFEDAEDIRPSYGRFPKHDNECMLAMPIAGYLGKKIGDTVTVRFGKIEADYVITGTVTAVTGSGLYTYMTDDAFRRLNPGFYTAGLDIYVNEGVDKEAFKEKVYGLYGTPASEDNDEELTGGTLAERIQAEADREIAILLEMYNLDSVDYAIQFDDELISGSSSKFKIRSGLDLMAGGMSQMAGMITAIKAGTAAFMAIAVIVILIIIYLMVTSVVKKQRGDLGILKGMGYSSKELMLQMAFRIVPTLVAAVVLGSIVGSFLLKVIVMNMYGNVPLSNMLLVPVDILVCIFGFAVAYFSARKIRKISVYELMQE